MAERKSQNKFIPNDYDPKRFRTINNYFKHKQNKLVGRFQQVVEDDIFESLKDRPVDSFHRTITVRFEMPFNIWCLGCKAHIGMGVRYNAEKKHIGMYFSTPLFQFKMKCHLCPNHIIINTDPKNAEYVIVEGARKRIEEYDPADIGVIVLKDEEETKRMENDAFYKLENTINDTTAQQSLAPKLIDIQKFNDKKWKDPYELSRYSQTIISRTMRKKFRTEKAEIKLVEQECKSLQDQHSLSINILPKSSVDDEIAGMVKFGEGPVDDLLEKRGESVFRAKKKAVLSTPSKEITARPDSKVEKKSAAKSSKDIGKNKLIGLVQKTRRGDPFGNF